MPKYKVQCFTYDAADGKGFQEIDAPNARAAAEKVCGGPMRSSQEQHGQLRARVRLVSDPRQEQVFYAPVGGRPS